MVAVFIKGHLCALILHKITCIPGFLKNILPAFPAIIKYVFPPSRQLKNTVLIRIDWILNNCSLVNCLLRQSAKGCWIDA